MKLLSIVAWTTAAITLLLMTVGGAVHATGSSLACPDWPLCYGQVFPEMVGGVAIEHTHRLLGATVGLLTLWLAALAWRRRDLRKLAVLAVVLVVIQGVLGGVTVLLRLSLLASTAHLAIALAFVGVLWTIGLRAREHERAPIPASPERRWVVIATLAVYAQAVLGGLVRHTYSGLACGFDPIGCGGAPWPTTPAATLHMSHRVAGVVVAALVIGSAMGAARHARRAGRPAAGLVAYAAIALVVAQIGLGVASVVSGLGVAAVTAHLTVAALLLVSLLSTHRLLAHAAPAPQEPQRRATAAASLQPRAS